MTGEFAAGNFIRTSIQQNEWASMRRAFITPAMSCNAR
jgi:hypothetical protein